MDYYAADVQPDPYAPPMKRLRQSEKIPEDEVVVLKEKVTVPVEKYPGYNFVGALLGPSGSFLKELQKNTKSRMAILGKGSMKDKKKEEELSVSEEAEHAHLKEPLHVLIDIKAPRSEAHRRMSEALIEVYKFMVPPDKAEANQQQQQQQFSQGPFDGYGGGGFGNGGYGSFGGYPQDFRAPPPPPRGGQQRGRGGPRGRGRGGPRGGGPRGR